MAYLSLRETWLELVGVMDDGRAGESFFGIQIVTVAAGVALGISPIVITSFKKVAAIRESLLFLGEKEDSIASVTATAETDMFKAGKSCA